jgi:ATP-binding cassette subfamily B protein
MLRMLEPLLTPTSPAAGLDSGTPAGEPATAGVRIVMEGVEVRAAGHSVLRGVSVSIPAGAHVAVVGASGAGKSTLVGLLLGWYAAAAGQLLVDGRPLDAAGVHALRRVTAWVDPAVHLWNRSLVENLQYGNPFDTQHAAGFAVAAADLQELIEKLPQGLQTPLGEGGALVSGGEGQRVRLGRALLRPDVRLVILDEPFRGLDRGARHALMAFVREHWRGATLVCVSHDVAGTQDFDRVLVVDAGAVVEDGDPRELAGADSLYRTLLTTERDVRERLWSSPVWRHLRIDDGRLVEMPPGSGA